MSPLAISLVVAAAILAGAVLGAVLRERLPGHHLAEETKDMVKVGIGFLTMLAAVVLGLLVTSAKSAFDTRTEEVQMAAAKVSLLHHNLLQIGPAADAARQMLRRDVALRVDEIWGGGDAGGRSPDGKRVTPLVEQLQDALRAIAPQGDAQRLAWSRSLQLVDDLAEIRSLAVAHRGSSITMPLLVLLVGWLVFIAVGMNVFAPRNGTIHALNVLCAASSAGAIFLLLELDRPFGGLIRISDAPLRQVLLQFAQ